jgi:hypothetical protein
MNILPRAVQQVPNVVHMRACRCFYPNPTKGFWIMQHQPKDKRGDIGYGFQLLPHHGI